MATTEKTVITDGILPEGATLSEWAQFVGMDFDGTVTEFEFKPKAFSSYSYWKSSGGRYQRIGRIAGLHTEWRDSLRKVNHETGEV